MIVTAIRSTSSSFVKSWKFALAMAGYDLRARHYGSVLGSIWLVLRPFVHVSLYLAITFFLVGGRIAAQGGGAFGYILTVLPTLMIWQVLHRTLEEAPSLVRERMDTIKQVVYPIETIPVTSIISASIGPAIGIVLWFALAAYTGTVGWSILLLPFAVALLALFLVGASWLAMLVGVVFKDLREILGLVLGIGIFATPALLTRETASPALWRIIEWNPLSHIVLSFRDVFSGTYHPGSWALFAVMAMLCFVLGAMAVFKAKTVINEYL